MEGGKKIVVSYLPRELTQMDFKIILSERTPGLATCNTVLNEGKTANKGYGFATYLTNELALGATAILDGLPMGRKQLRAVMFEQREGNGAFNNLYIRGIPSTWTNEEFLTYFNGFGQVVNGQLIQKNAADATKTGFVRYTTQSNADKVVSLHKNSVCGIVAERHFDEGQLMAYRQKREQESHVLVPDAEGKSGLALKMYFQTIVDKKIVKCVVENGTGIVVFADPESAEAAIEVTNFIPHGLKAQKLFP